MRKVVFVYFNSFYFPSIYGEATYLCFSIKYLLNTGLNHFIPRQTAEKQRFYKILQKWEW